jgi:glycerol uptake facilitator-like aquaporin
MVAKLAAEFLGTALIVATVLGAGFAQAALGAGSALGLFMIAVSVASVLYVCISMLGPISRAHFNPVVSLALLIQKATSLAQTIAYISAQVLGALAGALVANLMFASDFVFSSVARTSPGAFLGEVVATAGLVLIVLLLIRFSKTDLIASAIALWILAGHIFTSSTSFANPAVTIGRVVSNSPSSIAPDSALWFILAQMVGLLVSLVLYSILVRKQGMHE